MWTIERRNAVKGQTALHHSAIACFNIITVVSTVVEHANFKMELFKRVTKRGIHTVSSFSTTSEIIFPITCNI